MEYGGYMNKENDFIEFIKNELIKVRKFIESYKPECLKNIIFNENDINEMFKKIIGIIKSCKDDDNTILNFFSDHVKNIINNIYKYLYI